MTIYPGSTKSAYLVRAFGFASCNLGNYCIVLLIPKSTVNCAITYARRRRGLVSQVQILGLAPEAWSDQ